MMYEHAIFRNSCVRQLINEISARIDPTPFWGIASTLLGWSMAKRLVLLTILIIITVRYNRITHDNPTAWGFTISRVINHLCLGSSLMFLRQRGEHLSWQRCFGPRANGTNDCLPKEAGPVTPNQLQGRVRDQIIQVWVLLVYNNPGEQQTKK